MKQVALLTIFLSIAFASYSQYSFKDISTSLRKDSANEVQQTQAIRQFIDELKPGTKLSEKTIIETLKKQIKDSVENYNQKRLNILSTYSKDNDAKVEQLNKKLDTIVMQRKELIHRLKFDDRSRIFFPAYYSSHAIAFFEGDPVHQRLFQNNLVNYSPKTKKMTLYTEAVNDYLGPLRVGIGFQIKSDAKVDSLSTADSTVKEEKKAGLVSDLQNGGGDISVNFKLPLFRNKSPNTLIQSKFSLYANTGFSLPILGQASDDFLFNYDLGIEGVLYAKGFNNKLTFFTHLKDSYYSGNENFKKVITDADKDDPTSFAVFQTSVGIDFMDGYRLRVDLFSGNSFVKNNFPATVTFIIRPDTKSDKK
jgi:hypothetical protein